MRKDFKLISIRAGLRIGLNFCLSILILFWLINFAYHPENLPALSFPAIATFFFGGLFFAEASLLLFVFILPLFPLEPVFHGGSGFSVAELSFLSWCAGILLKRSFFQTTSPKRHIADFNENYGAVGNNFFIHISMLIFGLIAFLSALMTTLATSLYFTPVFLQKIFETISEVFSNTQQTAEGSWRAFLTLTESFFIFFIIKRFTTDWKKFRSLLWVIYLSSLVVSLVGLFQFISSWRLLPFWLGQGPLGRRLNATFPDVNSCGTFLAVAIFISLSLWQEKSSRKWILLPGFVLQTFALLLTFSRIAIFSFIIALVLFCWLNFPSAEQTRRRLHLLTKYGRCLLWLALLFITIFTIFLRLIPASGIKFHRSLPELNHILRGRLNFWHTGLLMWRDAPIWGQGIGQYYRLSPLYWDKDAPDWNPQYENAHNYFLQLAAETGIIGEFAFLLLIASLFSALLNKCKDLLNQPKIRRSFTAIFCTVVIIVLTSLSGHPLLVKEIFYLFMITSALGLSGVYKISHTEESIFSLLPEKTFLCFVLILVITSLPFRWSSAITSQKPDYFAAGLRPAEYSTTDNCWFHWTKQKAIIYLRYLPWRMIKFDVKNPLGAHYPIKAKLFVGGLPAGELHLQNNEWQLFAFPALVPLRRYVRVEIIVDKLWQPNRLFANAIDRRELGLMIRFPYYGYEPGYIQPHTNPLLFPPPAP